MTDVKDATESRKSLSQSSVRMPSTGKCVRAGRRDEASPSGSQPGTKQDWLSHTSLRRLQVLHSTKLTSAQKDEVTVLSVFVTFVDKDGG